MINMPGGPEMMVIILVALIVLGPQQLPKAMRTFGNVMAEIRKVSSGFQAEMKSAMDSITDTDSSTSKPQSGPMSAVEHSRRAAEAEAAAGAIPSATADTPEAADVTEVVARNDAPAPGAATPADVDDARPAIDPVDRAAG